MQQALITGASSGIGAEFARQLHERGERVVLIARRAALLAEMTEKFNELRPGSADFVEADLVNPSGASKVERYMADHQVDILVNNAGRGSFGYFDELPVEQELEMVNLNVAAFLRLAHAAARQMKARRRGVILNISSIAAFQPLPYMATYAATKSFEFSHSLAMRYELAPFGVKVIVVCPGPTATEFGGVARVPGKLTGIRRDSAVFVVQQSLAALDRNKAWVVPGIRANAISLLSRLLPKRFSAWCMEKALYSSLKEA